MNLADLFAYLTYGELANLKVGGKECGGIYPKYSDEVASFVHQGLSDLHSKFNLKHNELILQQYDHITMYTLSTEYAVSNEESSVDDKWIVDTTLNPFLGDILRIEEVYNENGEELFVNTESRESSIFTPSYNVLQIPEPDGEMALSVIYKANHVPIDLSEKVPKDITIDLPDVLVQPLCLYVASLAHNSVGSPEGVQLGLQKMQEYRAACVEAQLQGVVHTESYTNDRIWRNGWV